MRDAEIAYVQLRKAAQQRSDLRIGARSELGDALTAGMLEGLLACVDEHSWILGHEYSVAAADAQSAVETEEEPGGAILESDRPRRPRLQLRFLGRTQVPPHGGFAADVLVESGSGWRHLIGLADWQEEQLQLLPELWSDIADQP